MAARTRRARSGPAVDERTLDMPSTALACRARPGGHLPRLLPTSRERLREMVALGYREEVYVCDGGCGYTRTITYDRATGVPISDTGGRYTDRSYLVPKGTGALSRAEARRAWWERDEAGL